MEESSEPGLQRTGNAPKIAIVGSGPSGCYTAQFLRKKWPESVIVIFDRHEKPYGLIRYGVAPDHLGTKGIARQFERLFAKERVVFRGGVEVGRDITLEDLKSDYDIVVLATGLWADKTVKGFHHADGTPTHDGVYGSGTITRMINGHPDRQTAEVQLGQKIVIVGTGNVAVDLIRLILTSPNRLAELGVPEDAIAAITREGIQKIDVVGRSSASQAKFDVAMIRELGKINDVHFASDLDDDPLPDGEDSEKRNAVIDLTRGSSPNATRQVMFHFGWTPDHLEGTSRLQHVVFRRSADIAQTLRLDADSVCTAVGFCEITDDILSRSSLESETAEVSSGRLADGIYCVGWYRRGPVGTIPANRADARMVVDTIIKDVECAAVRDSSSALMTTR